MKHLNQFEIQDYLDGNLPERAAEIRTHLADCRLCREELRQYETLFADLVALEPPRPAVGFADRVMEQLPEGEPSSLAERLWKILPISFAAAVALVGSIIWLDWSWLSRLLPSIHLAAVERQFNAGLAFLHSALPLDQNLLAISVGVVLLLVYLDKLLRQARHRTLQVW